MYGYIYEDLILKDNQMNAILVFAHPNDKNTFIELVSFYKK